MTQNDTIRNGGNTAVFSSVSELARFLNMGRKCTYDGLKNGSIPSIRLSRRFVLPRVAIERWLEQAGQRTTNP
jgi:excisionase family DNA binding protein